MGLNCALENEARNHPGHLEGVENSGSSSKTIRVIGGHPLLAQAATDAIHKWRWVPAGQETTEVIEMKFNPE
jgi:hypothetical protein